MRSINDPAKFLHYGDIPSPLRVYLQTSAYLFNELPLNFTRLLAQNFFSNPITVLISKLYYYKVYRHRIVCSSHYMLYLIHLTQSFHTPTYPSAQLILVKYSARLGASQFILGPFLLLYGHLFKF